MMNICRTCVTKQVEMISIFNQVKSPSISDMIIAVSPLEFLPNDKLSSQMCIACFETLQISYYFKEQLIRSNNALQRHARTSKLLARCKMLAQQQVNKDSEKWDDEEDLTNDQSKLSSLVNTLEFANKMNICRICLTKKVVGKMVSIFDQDLLPSISAMLMSISSFECLSNDGLPSEICSTCLTTLELTYYFKEQVIRCNNTLQKQSQRNKLLSKPPQQQILAEKQTLSQQQKGFRANEEIGEINEENEQLRNVSIVDSIDEISTGNVDVYNVDDHLSIEPLTSKTRGDNLLQVTSSTKKGDVNSHSKKSVTESVDVGGEEHSVQFTEVDVPLSREEEGSCKSRVQGVQQNSKVNGEVLKSQASKGIYGDLKKQNRMNTVAVKPKRHKCEICGKAFKLPSKVVLHMRTHTGEKPYKCQLCTAAFSQRYNLHLHMRKHTGQYYKCEICERSFASRCYFKQHLRKEHTDPMLKCEHCKVKSTDAGTLQKHICEHTGEATPKPHKCAVCEKAFAYRSTLLLHLRTHSDEKPFKCQHCDATYKQKSTLKLHMKVHTGNDAPPSYKCEVCGRTFTNNQGLKIHIRRHTGENPYKCRHCNSMFASNSLLIKHTRRKHSATAKRHKCEVCEKKFESPSELNVHLRGHTGERPFKCQHCSKAFTSSSYLTQHLRVHVGTPFKCQHCDARFAQKGTLTNHMRRMHLTEATTDSNNC